MAKNWDFGKSIEGSFDYDSTKVFGQFSSIDFLQNIVNLKAVWGNSYDIAILSDLKM